MLNSWLGVIYKVYVFHTNTFCHAPRKHHSQRDKEPFCGFLNFSIFCDHVKKAKTAGHVSPFKNDSADEEDEEEIGGHEKDADDATFKFLRWIGWKRWLRMQQRKQWILQLGPVKTMNGLKTHIDFNEEPDGFCSFML